MKQYILFISAIFVVFLFNIQISAQTFEYISPRNNSTLVSLKTNIILKSADEIDEKSLSQNEFEVNGSKSGLHKGEVKLSDDNKTILFIPSSLFEADEMVSVIIKPGIKTLKGEGFSQESINFKTTPLLNPINYDSLSSSNEGFSGSQNNSATLKRTASRIFATDSLPFDIPKIVMDTSDNPAPGKLFIANQSGVSDGSIGNYILIINNDGSVAKYKSLPKPANLFKMELNGDLSYNLKGSGDRIINDTAFNPVDTLRCGNGYKGNGHDGLLLPNGHGILFANDPEPVDMSKVVPGGNPDAIVTGVVIQEIDSQKNVIFQWRSWDYLPITDSYFDLTAQNIDLIHANALAVDLDGNILISMRHLSCIVKIDRETGNISWILGGKENQFTFVNEHESNSPTYFSYQHDISVLPNGNITLFDNGNQHSPQYSRGVEYKLDEKNMTATLVWEYRHSPDIYADAMGSTQRLQNGNTIIGWGMAGRNGNPVFTEVHPDNSIALEMTLPDKGFSYRTYKYSWVSQLPSATVTAFEVLQGNTYTFNSSTDTTGITIKFSKLNADIYANATISKYNYSPLKPVFTTSAPIVAAYYFNIDNQSITSFTGLFNVNLKYYPDITKPDKIIVYAREQPGQPFQSIATSYDSAKNELVFTASSFGDYIFAIPQVIDSSYAPVPFSPNDSEVVDVQSPVELMWGTRGIVHGYHVQVAEDPSFNNIIADDSNLTTTNFTIDSLINNTDYYWRVNNTNVKGTSNWSEIFSFHTSSPFISISYPDGGETFYKDSTYIVRWEANISDTVRIVLLKGDVKAAVIADSLVALTNAFEWIVPSDLQADSSYKIKIISISEPDLADTSNGSFAINLATGVNEINGSLPKTYTLNQNYPNPFNPSTVISYSLPQQSHVKIEIFNALGQRVADIVNGFQHAGHHQIRWDAGNLSSGIYIYSIHAGGANGKNFFSVKKMVLLK